MAGCFRVHAERVSGRLLATTPPEIVVRDEEDDCVYLPGRRARQPLRQPIRRLTAAEFDTRLAAGDRRAGSLLYNQACPSCEACQAIRVDVHAFAPSRSQRRAQASGDAAVTVELGPIVVDDRRVSLYRAHELGRGLDHSGRPPIDALEYESFFAHSCVEGFELRYLVGGQLCGVAITDRGARSLSAVYTFWNPAYARALAGDVFDSDSDRARAELGARLGLSRARRPGEPLDGLQAGVHAARAARGRRLAAVRPRVIAGRRPAFSALRDARVTSSAEAARRWWRRGEHFVHRVGGNGAVSWQRRERHPIGSGRVVRIGRPPAVLEPSVDFAGADPGDPGAVDRGPAAAVPGQVVVGGHHGEHPQRPRGRREETDRD